MTEVSDVHEAFERVSILNTIGRFSSELSQAFASGDVEIGLPPRLYQRLISDIESRRLLTAGDHGPIRGAIDLYMPSGTFRVGYSRQERARMARRSAWGKS